MAGHSKWSNIKARKGAQDKKKAKIFSRVIKEITIAIKENGNNGDPETNPALRNAIQNARGANLPKDNIDRAIKRASGTDSQSYKHLNFEGYGPHGIAMFVECTTDNTNRTVANVRAIFNKYGGNMGTNGSLEFLFDRLGVFTIAKEKLTTDWEELQFVLIEHGAESFEEEDEVFLIYSDYKSFGTVSDKLLEMNIETQNAAVELIPNHTEVLPLEEAMAIITMIDAFEDDDDVQNVYHSLELTDELSEELANM